MAGAFTPAKGWMGGDLEPPITVNSVDRGLDVTRFQKGREIVKANGQTEGSRSEQTGLNDPFLMTGEVSDARSHSADNSTTSTSCLQTFFQGEFKRFSYDVSFLVGVSRLEAAA